MCTITSIRQKLLLRNKKKNKELGRIFFLHTVTLFSTDVLEDAEEPITFKDVDVHVV
jgi:hypothetical protein